MRTHLLLLATLLCSVTQAQQVPPIEWQRSLGGTERDIAFSIQCTPDGGSIVAGESWSVDGDVQAMHTMREAWVLKLDASGTVQWDRTYGGSDVDSFWAITTTTDSNYIAVGFTSSSDGDADQVNQNCQFFDHLWAVKLDSLGNVLWNKNLGGCNFPPPQDGGTSVQGTADGGCIIGGVRQWGAVNQYYVWVVKLGATGIVQWQQYYGGPGGGAAAKSIIQTSDGGYLVGAEAGGAGGDISFSHGGWDVWLLKLNSVGGLEWEKCYGGSSEEAWPRVVETEDGNYVFCAETSSQDGDVGPGLGSYWVACVDSVGDLLWEHRYGGSLSERPMAILQDQASKDLFIGGFTHSQDGDVTGHHLMEDYWVIRTDTNGILLGQACFGGMSTDEMNGMAITPTGGLLLAGESESVDFDVTQNHGMGDFWVVKLEDLTTGVGETEQGELFLSPNPTTGHLQVNFKDNDLVGTLEVLDAQGRVALRLPMNRSALDIDLSQLPKGLYLVTFLSAKGKISQRVVLE